MKKIIFICLFFTSLSYSIEIPLQGSGGLSLGYVDMNKLFDEYPPVKTAKKDYEKVSEQKKTELSMLDYEISVIKSSCTDLEVQIKQLKQEEMSLKVQKQQLYTQIQQQQIQAQQPEVVIPSSNTIITTSSGIVTVPLVSTTTAANNGA